MTDRASAEISSRNSPKQARSNELVAAVLEAAVQVLAKEGAQRFTTARVAERAGVSVGSLYQYFPNKAAILFRLQSDEWRGRATCCAPSSRTRKPPLKRLRDARPRLPPLGMRGGRGPRRAQRRRAALPRRARGARGEGAGRRIVQALPAGGAAGRLGRARASPADLIVRRSARWQQFSEGPEPRGDRGLRRRHGGHVLRLPSRARPPVIGAASSRARGASA